MPSAIVVSTAEQVLAYWQGAILKSKTKTNKHAFGQTHKSWQSVLFDKSFDFECGIYAWAEGTHCGTWGTHLKEKNLNLGGRRWARQRGRKHLGQRKFVAVMQKSASQWALPTLLSWPAQKLRTYTKRTCSIFVSIRAGADEFKNLLTAPVFCLLSHANHKHS